MHGSPSLLRKFLLLSAKPSLFFYGLIWLIVLVIVGTISQKYIGLYRSQELFFSSWYFWAGPIPLPGAMPVMVIIFWGLMVKLCFFSRWNRAQSGVNILHIGSAALLFGGFLTAVFAEEGGMVVREGETVNFASSYNEAEFVLVHRNLNGEDTIYQKSFTELEAGKEIWSKELPFQVNVARTCKNCDLVRRSRPEPGAIGFAANFMLVDKALDAEHEKNQRGLVFMVEGEGVPSGTYAIYEFMPVVQTMPMPDGSIISFHLRRTRQHLPFAIRLIDFRRTLHPGTEMAKSYESDVELIDGDYRKETTIRMNEPLRYKGYTLFQSSFDLSGDKETSVFAVVKNVGWLFPYVSSLIMALGLLIHLLLQVPRLIESSKKTSNSEVSHA